MGYSEAHPCCRDCKYIEMDDSTDHFGAGNLCVRNPDLAFKVSANKGYCNKYKKKAEIE